MRIITGTARGTKLETLEGEATRPTTIRTKEGMFSAIQFRIEGRRVLDLFCGCGQLALEALSRGAEFAVMVDSERDAVDIAKQNANKTKLMKQVRLLCTDYKEYLNSCKEKFGLVFIDPPYASGFCDEALKILLSKNLLEDGAVVVCETSEDAVPSDFGFAQSKRYKYGKTIITILEYIQ